MPLRLGAYEAPDGRLLVMAIINRTPDSFYDQGATFARDAALEAVDRAVDEGADLVDIGGVKAGPGAEVDVVEEIERTAGFVADVRARHPDLVISVDTWRHEVGRVCCEAGADVLNDAWGGVDPLLAEVAAEYGAGLVCTHAGGVEPRTRPHRIGYDDVMADIVSRTVSEAERAVVAGSLAGGRTHRPGSRLRQEHQALPRGDPQAGRDGRDRLAGPGLVVQQGLRRRDARPTCR